MNTLNSRQQKQQIIESIKKIQSKLNRTEDYVTADKLRQQLRDLFASLRAAQVHVMSRDSIHIGQQPTTIRADIWGYTLQSLSAFESRRNLTFTKNPAILQIKMYHINDREVPTIALKINDESFVEFTFEACFFEENNFIRLMTNGAQHLIWCDHSVDRMNIVQMINEFFYGTVSASDNRVNLGFSDHRVRNPSPGGSFVSPGQLGCDLLAQLRF